MLISFSGRRTGFRLKEPKHTEQDCADADLQSVFNIDPDWIDLTPDYDPSGRASELDVLENAEIDLNNFSVHLEWMPGGQEAALQSYNNSRQFSGLPRTNLDNCRTVIRVHELDALITCFLSDANYGLMRGHCERFAVWPNPKYYAGQSHIPLLAAGLLIALDPDALVGFWKGNFPAYSTKIMEVSFAQNQEPKARIGHLEKRAYHLSQT